MRPWILFAMLAPLVAVGCKKKLCPAGEPPAAFADYKSQFPQNVVICDPNWTPDGSEPHPQTHGVHVYYKDVSTREAWNQTQQWFRSKGWTVKLQGGDVHDDDLLPDLVLTDVKGTVLTVMINKTRLGTHAHYDIRPAT